MMPTEIEAKFLNVDHSELRLKLKVLGAHCEQPMRLMRRKTYDFPDGRLSQQRTWVRVRDEGSRVTVSCKQKVDDTLLGIHEVCITVDDFNTADQLLQAIGLEAKSYQETKRESWRYKDFEIELDEWPWAKPFVEIEGPDEESLRSLAGKLGLDWVAARYGDVWSVYDGEYEIGYGDLNAIPIITFEEPVPGWLASKRRP